MRRETANVVRVLVAVLLESVALLLGKTLLFYRQINISHVLTKYRWCGTTEEYCTSPDCQYQYGPACDANVVPAGESTASIARTKVGNVAYGGAGIYDCVTAGEVALTFDDGPYLYTSHILDILESYNASATFFITGNNNGKGQIDNEATGYPDIIKRMYNYGHQIASHTWSHQNFTALDTVTFHDQVYYNEMALRNILGVIPTYLRPPYSECNDTCGAILGDLGYHVTYFDLDTQDYLHDDPTLIQTSKDIFSAALSSTTAADGDFLAIGHDIHYQTAYNLTTFMLDTIEAQGYTAVTVGQCLGDPKANWYRDASGTSSSATTTATTSAATSTVNSALVISTDATCGTGLTCQGSTFGNCCSQAGWCGSTTDYCGTGCQSAFGTCGTTSAASTSVAAKAVSSVSSAQSSKSSATAKSSSSSASSSVKAVSSVSSVASVKSSSTSTVAKVASSSSSLKTSSTTSAKAKSTALTISKDGTCGSTTTCLGSTFGTCCSTNGWCGSTTAYCLKSKGCKTGFGLCL